LANEITFTVKLDDKGSLALVTKEAKKTADSLGKVEGATKKANKGQDHFARGAKGVGQAGLSASKGFSKMRDSMGGSNGLVSAYAILAANIFAATAAFNALRRAAQVEQLEKGLRLVGAAAGQNLPDVAERLREVTGAAVSAEQSMRATALAMSAGFRSDQLIQLTKVAKGASIALGRDMGDALDRLVRGTAKLEPEILDELGIMVRLDEAVQDYADKLNIASDKLTQFDRRQAFLNATLEQGLKKYEDMSQAIDSNPYDKLAASLADLQKNFIKTTSAITGLASGVEFASRHLASLAAVGTTLALGITRGVAPGMFRLADSAAATANGALTARAELAGLATEGTKLPPKFAKLAGALQNGTASSKEFATANNSLQGQLGGLTRGLNGLTRGTEEYASKSAEIQGVRNQMKDLAELEDLQGKARVTNARATAIGSAANFQLRDSFGSLKSAFQEDKINTEAATKGKKGFRNSLKTLGPAFRIAGTGAKAFGAALFTALPYIGLIISGVTILYGYIKDKFFPEDLVKKRIEDAKKSFEQFSEVQAHFMSSTSTGGRRMAESYIALAGVLESIEGKIRDVSLANLGTYAKRLAAENVLLDEQQVLLDQANEDKKTFTFSRANAQDDNAAPRRAYRAEQAILGIKEDIAETEDLMNNAQLEASKQILAGALFQLDIQSKVAERTGVSAFNTQLMKDSVEQLTALQVQLENNEITASEFLVELELIRRMPNAVRDSFAQIDTLTASFNATMGKRTQKVKKMFQDEEDGAQAIIDKFEELTIVSGGVDLKGELVSSKRVEEAKELLAELATRITKLNVNKEFEDGKEGLDSFVTFLQTSRTKLEGMAKSIATAKASLVELGKAAKGIIGGQAFLDRKNKTILEQEIELLDEQYKVQLKLSGKTEEEFKLSEDAVELAKKRAAAEAKIIPERVISAKNAVDELKTLKKISELSKKRLSNEVQLNKIITQARASGGKLTPQLELKLQTEMAELKIKTAKLDLAFTMAKIKAERALLVAQFGGKDKLTADHKEVLRLLDAQNAVVQQMARQSVSAAETGVTSAIQGSMSGFDTGYDRMGSNGLGVEGFKMQMEAVKNLAVATNTLAEAESNLTEKKLDSLSAQVALEQAQMAGEGEAGATQAANDAILAAKAAEAVVLQAQQNVKNAAFQMVSDTMTGLSKTLEQLGPDGALAAAFGNLGNIMLTSVVGALEVMGTTGAETSQKLAAGFAAAANIIGGIASILSAQANQQVAAVDQQIEAEKKRDGQSAASVAKMKAMEAKKDQIKKKAFATNKKLMIAQAIMATAAGMAGAMAITTPYELPIGMMVAGLIAAMGAAQIAIISGMSYQGGGGAPAAAKPSAVTVGSRNNTVDVGRGNNAGGELAYMRGERGQGTGATDFKPGSAFTGAKYRASGGETAGFMVGEQGPELFIPDRSGRIAPADETASMGTTSNVNFNISAVDAAGVEDVLVRQKGHIIRMIREAANEHGQPFLEDISDGSYTS
jgi:hypothetical protein